MTIMYLARICLTTMVVAIGLSTSCANAKDTRLSQFNKALAYHLGRGVTFDIAKARSLYRSSASLGFTPAMVNLALLDLAKTGDNARASVLMKKPSELGDVQAISFQGEMMLTRERNPKDGLRIIANAARTFQPRAYLYSSIWKHGSKGNVFYPQQDVCKRANRARLLYYADAYFVFGNCIHQSNRPLIAKRFYSEGLAEGLGLSGSGLLHQLIRKTENPIGLSSYLAALAIMKRQQAAIAPVSELPEMILRNIGPQGTGNSYYSSMVKAGHKMVDFKSAISRGEDAGDAAVRLFISRRELYFSDSHDYRLGYSSLLDTTDPYDAEGFRDAAKRLAVRLSDRSWTHRTTLFTYGYFLPLAADIPAAFRGKARGLLDLSKVIGTRPIAEYTPEFGPSQDASYFVLLMAKYRTAILRRAIFMDLDDAKLVHSEDTIEQIRNLTVAQRAAVIQSLPLDLRVAYILNKLANNGNAQSYILLSRYHGIDIDISKLALLAGDIRLKKIIKLYVTAGGLGANEGYIKASFYSTIYQFGSIQPPPLKEQTREQRQGLSNVVKWLSRCIAHPPKNSYDKTFIEQCRVFLWRLNSDGLIARATPGGLAFNDGLLNDADIEAAKNATQRAGRKLKLDAQDAASRAGSAASEQTESAIKKLKKQLPWYMR